ncbi:MAG: stage III sporulation protein AD [Ruminococcaceae bacterium]|nr:stage III sporulation protein AD [Oscillospiraceae bacterium]
MDMIKLIGIGVTGAVSAILLKEYKPVYAICIAIITSALIFLMTLSEIKYVFSVIDTISQRLSLNSEYIRTIIRIIGFSYLSRFGSEICRDAGQNAIAQKIEFAGKVMIIATSIPILTSVLNLLIGILPT